MLKKISRPGIQGLLSERGSATPYLLERKEIGLQSFSIKLFGDS